MDRSSNRLPVVLSREQRSTLERWARAGTTPQRVVLRSAIVLLASEGLPIMAIAKRLDTSRSTVKRWCQRFRAGGPPGLLADAPGRGRKPRITAARIAEVLNETGGQIPIRQLARRLDTSPSAVHRALEVYRQFRNKDDDE